MKTFVVWFQDPPPQKKHVSIPLGVIVGNTFLWLSYSVKHSVANLHFTIWIQHLLMQAYMAVRVKHEHVS